MYKVIIDKIVVKIFNDFQDAVKYAESLKKDFEIVKEK